VIKLSNLLRLTRSANLHREINARSQVTNLARQTLQLKGEYLQDLWILAETNTLRGGYFVDFGATDGVDASNTFILESHYGWRGIACEPGSQYFEKLKNNRKCHVSNRLVWDVSGEEIEFLELDEAYLSGAIADSIHSGVLGNEYTVTSITLEDLLISFDAPKVIDYASIDVEGSELRILRKFFSQNTFQIRFLTVEHNWRQDKSELRDLLEINNYEIVFEEISQRDFWCRLKTTQSKSRPTIL